jgi:hypothetical protein
VDSFIPYLSETVGVNPSLFKKQGQGITFRRGAVLAIGVMVVATFGNVVFAAGATRGVEAKPGDIVLLRDVPHRIATRPGYPGNALLLDVGPEEQIAGAMRQEGLVEINDQDAAVIHSGISTQVARPLSPTLQSNPLENSGSTISAGSLGATNGVVMRSLSNINRVTDGIASKVNSATGSLGRYIGSR